MKGDLIKNEDEKRRFLDTYELSTTGKVYGETNKKSGRKWGVYLPYI